MVCISISRENRITDGSITVAIDYHRFIPTGGAYLTLVTSDPLNFNLTALRNATISSLPITSVSSPPPTSSAARTRGTKGRMAAAERGLFLGTDQEVG
jgi:hypothetical protein